MKYKGYLSVIYESIFYVYLSSVILKLPFLLRLFVGSRGFVLQIPTSYQVTVPPKTTIYKTEKGAF